MKVHSFLMGQVMRVMEELLGEFTIEIFLVCFFITRTASIDVLCLKIPTALGFLR